MSRGRKHVPVPAEKPTPAIPPPATMSKAAAKEWRRVVAMLTKARTLTELDISVLTDYCDAFVLYATCQAHIDEHGPVVLGTTGTPVKNPYLLAQREASERLRNTRAELGLTPSARAKLGMKGEGEKGDGDDDGIKF